MKTVLTNEAVVQQSEEIEIIKDKAFSPATRLPIIRILTKRSMSSGMASVGINFTFENSLNLIKR